jgi:hypothetical protein
MEPKSGFLQDRHGHNSSSRLLGFSVVIYALVLSTTLLVAGIVTSTPLLLIASAAGTLFTTIAGPAMFFMFSNKKEEMAKITTPDESKP